MRSDEPWWLEPYPDDLLGYETPGPEARYDARESIALSFVASLQHLPPQQRAVLVLRDVLGFRAAEVAVILGTTPAAVNSALIRARAGIRPDTDADTVPLPWSPAEAAVVERFVDAFERFDLGQLVALLTDDARLVMPPEPVEFRGPRAVAGFLEEHLWRARKSSSSPPGPTASPPSSCTSQCAPIWRASSFVVLRLRGNQVSMLTRFGELGLLARFGLPRTPPRA